MIAAHYLGEIPVGMTVDHVDGDGLNNRIENLQYLTHSEQAAKRKNPPRLLPPSKYRGVYYGGEGWKAILKGVDDEERHVVIFCGWYRTEESAARRWTTPGL